MGALTLDGDLEKPCLFFWGAASAMASWRSPAHQKVLEKSLGIKDQSCPMLRLGHKAMCWRTQHVVSRARTCRVGVQEPGPSSCGGRPPGTDGRRDARTTTEHRPASNCCRLPANRELLLRFRAHEQTIGMRQQSTRDKVPRLRVSSVALRRCYI